MKMMRLITPTELTLRITRVIYSKWQSSLIRAHLVREGSIECRSAIIDFSHQRPERAIVMLKTTQQRRYIALNLAMKQRHSLDDITLDHMRRSHMKTYYVGNINITDL